MANPMSLNRLEKRFLKCGDAIKAAELMGNRTAANIARAEWQQCYNMLGQDRARELLDLKYA